ncbi:hypothetical protein CHO01_16970 [Cellulomonas hominis]|uniref:Uncharacterized protein n=1 Tax=Cellulomonas hominis TaxID=156981 RepID=A0A511FBD8_9CELL|nr:hypothetical protein [Cellulomonas hominis]MBB5474544.1 hypothetical protein [Cellulomonas hominis]NKY05618.1 hypothetical protein [Cellulomonas hominis]GEL46581.1 hypothetical protein CHO01_16970 [Cellulomonas hominis]
MSEHTPTKTLLARLTNLQRVTLEQELAAGGVVAYGLAPVGTIENRYVLEVLRQVEPDGLTDPNALPWQVVQRFWHGWRETSRLGLAQATLRLATLREAGGVRVAELPAMPAGFAGWR